MITTWCYINGLMGSLMIPPSLQNTDRRHQAINTLVHQLQEDTVLWSQLLEASGGKLELTKCFYYVLSWIFDKRGRAIPTSIADQQQLTAPITIPVSNDGDRIVILQKELSEAQKTLGTWKTIIGDETRHIKYLQDKSDGYALKVLHAHMNRRQARLAYATIYIPAMMYSLPAMNLYELALDTMLAVSRRDFLVQSFMAPPLMVVSGCNTCIRNQ